MNFSQLEIKFFGNLVSENKIYSKLKILSNIVDQLKFYLIISATNTSEIRGISAAGFNSKARRKTALADAEYLLFGPRVDFKYKLPFLNAGVSPALISNACAKLLDVNIDVIPIGIPEKPYFRHITLEDKLNLPAGCISSGNAMPQERVVDLYKKGLQIGISSNHPFFISESVPGGTSTAQAVMEAFGLNVSDLVGSSLKNPPRDLKRKIISKGLKKANLKAGFDSIDVIASLGDPFQALAIGIILGARKVNQTVILAGGSQMIAILLLALEYIDSDKKQDFVENIFIATTNWLVRDNALNSLLTLIANKHQVEILGIGSPLNFKSSKYKELKDYELGYVKEGVGAGGMSVLAYLKGFKSDDIINICEENIDKLREIGQISSEKED